MKIRKILVVYKLSIFEKSFQGSSLLKKKNPPVIASHLKKIIQVHRHHYNSLKKVCDVLTRQGISFDMAERQNHINLKSYDLILTVGGDGTFMEVSHQVKDQIVLGINSAPGYSVGRYCCTDAEHFSDFFDRFLNGRLKFTALRRLRLKLNGRIVSDCILNDFLVAHVHPAVMSRYILKIGSRKEEQKSSGVWISTPTGSSAGIKSAGGPVISSAGKSMVYFPRELHQPLKGKYVFKGGVLKPGQSLQVMSMMKDGMIYGDGVQASVVFLYGSVADIEFSAHPLKTIQRD